MISQRLFTNTPTKDPSLLTLPKLKGGTLLILSSTQLSLLLLQAAHRQQLLHLLKAPRAVAVVARVLRQVAA